MLQSLKRQINYLSGVAELPRPVTYSTWRNSMRSHGHTRGKAPTPTYMSYLAMKQRCLDPNSEKYPRYGGRGITICPTWRAGFEAFLEDMGLRPLGTTIGRIDNDGPYSKANCEWQSMTVQANNRSNNAPVEFLGQSKTIAQWAESIGLSYSALSTRIRRGWPLELAMDPSYRRRSRFYTIKILQALPAWKSEIRVCLECDEEFSPISSRSKFCSQRCRKNMTRKQSYHRNADSINARRREKWLKGKTDAEAEKD